MMKSIIYLGIIALIPVVLAASEYAHSDQHANSIAFSGSSYGACRKKHPENRILPGGAEACASHKPLKVKGIEKAGKRLCSDGYEYCSVSHKSLHHLSWKTEAMPESCFGFHYRKNKFAGYGHKCHRNLYFDGLLCCPSNNYKKNHDLRIGSNKLHHHRQSKNAQNLGTNFLKK